MKQLLLKVVNNSAVRKAFLALVLAILGALGYGSLTGCTAKQGEDAKTALAAVDSHVAAACAGLAQQLAQQAGSPDVSKIVGTTCAVDSVLRTMRELLLSQQIEAARAAGVFVPAVNSGAFEDAGAAAAE